MPPMASPGRPLPERETLRHFWTRVAEGLSSEDAAASCGVSAPVGARWFRQGGGMPSLSTAVPSGRYLSSRSEKRLPS